MTMTGTPWLDRWMGAPLVEAAGARTLSLHGDAQLLRDPGHSAGSGVGDHAGIDVAQHGPLVDGGLYHIGFGHGVVGGASLKDDGQVRALRCWR